MSIGNVQSWEQSETTIIKPIVDAEFSDFLDLGRHDGGHDKQRWSAACTAQFTDPF
jgi:hypothetical protein